MTGELELELETQRDLDGAERSATYSSLPPSPRGGEYSHAVDIDGVFKRLDLKRSDMEGSPKRRRLSLDSASAKEQESEREDVEDFWPARSRRPTIESAPLEEVEHFWEARSRRQTLESGQTPPIVANAVQPQSPIAEEEEPNDTAEPKEPPSIPGIEQLSIWDLLKDEDAAEQWEGWIADGKWYVGLCSPLTTGSG